MKCKQITITISVLLFSLQIAAQDLIYRKSGEIITAKILKTFVKSIEFQIPDKDSAIHYLNVSAIDSIAFQNGEKQTFKTEPNKAQLNPNSVSPAYNHHLVGVDLLGILFYRNITVSYEYLPDKAIIGFKGAFSKNIKPAGEYFNPFNFASNSDWTCRIGINGYLFAPRTFRLGAGLYYILGSYSNTPYYYDPNTSGEGNKTVSGVVISIFGFYNITKNLAFNLGMDFPSSVSPSSQSVLRGEFFINF